MKIISQCSANNMWVCFLHTMILHQSLHLFLTAFVPLGDVHVKGVVTAGLAVSPLPPLFEGCNQAGARLWHHVVDCKTHKQTGWISCAHGACIIKWHAWQRAHLHCYDPGNRMTVISKLVGMHVNLCDLTLTDHSRPPSQGCPGALIEVICCHHATIRHLESGVHINTPRHHHSPHGLYDLDSPRNN